MKIYFVDSFTSEPFKGNPAAVCFPARELDADTMQKIAAEIGFSETAFVRHRSGDAYDIRFFTPKIEIPLCGHATLASSKIVFATTTLESIRFTNRNGVELLIGKAGDKIRMQFPVYETEAAGIPDATLAALGVARAASVRFSPNNNIILLEIESSSELAALRPDFPRLIESISGINGILVTAVSETEEFDFHYRYFWGWVGTDEDPVTGGVQTFLTKYWATKLGKSKMNAFQSSARTGKMSVELVGDKVLILGEAVTVLEGELAV